MTELGWDTLETRRANQKTCLMYKIQNNLAPPYLIQSCPPLVGDISNYNLRNADNIALPMGRSTGYCNSFMPSSVRLWNGLSRSLKNSASVESLKYQLKKTRCRTKNRLYSKFNGSRAINHTRMRLGLSGLKAQRHEYNHVPRPTCDYCGARKEDTMHYFLQCQVFANMRIVLLNGIRTLYRRKNIILDLTRTIVQKELVKHMLKGDDRLSDQENMELFGIVQLYICSSKRF
jgi:hypothetical protein